MQSEIRDIGQAVPGKAPPSAKRSTDALSLGKLDVGRLAFLIGMVTSSFDVFLVANAGGFTLRPCQVLLPVSLAYAIGLCVSDAKIRLPLGIVPLVVWMLFIFAFVPNTPLLLRNVGYAGWLVLDFLLIVVCVQLSDDIKRSTALLRWYLYSFQLVAIIGLGQFTLGVLHLPAPYVRQWVIPGWWPRINGFSYEPSYFATYLVMGWVLSAWLLERRSEILPRKVVFRTFVLTTAALMLATSRLGWAMMILWGCGYGLRSLKHLAPIRLRLPTWIVLVNLLVLLLTGVALAAVHKADRLLQILAGGTGLFGTAEHSVVLRQNSLDQTIALVKKSPFIGYSLGGIAPAIGEEMWESGRLQTQVAAKQHEGLAVFVEVLAASGVIGFIPFVVYVLMLLIAPLVLARTCPPAYRPLLTGLVWALVLEFIILQFSQNILRPYLWFHLAVLSAVYGSVKHDVVSRRRNSA